jgi:hypothetical protein
MWCVVVKEMSETLASIRRHNWIQMSLDPSGHKVGRVSLHKLTMIVCLLFKENMLGSYTYLPLEDYQRQGLYMLRSEFVTPPKIYYSLLLLQ